MRGAIIGFILGATAAYLNGSFMALDLSWIIERGHAQSVGRLWVLVFGLVGAVVGSRP